MYHYEYRCNYEFVETGTCSYVCPREDGGAKDTRVGQEGKKVLRWWEEVLGRAMKMKKRCHWVKVRVRDGNGGLAAILS